MLRKIAVCAIATGTLSASVLYASDNEAYAKCVSELAQSKKSNLSPSDLDTCYTLSTEWEDAAAATDAAADPDGASDAASDSYGDATNNGWPEEHSVFRDGRLWGFVGSSSSNAELYVDRSSIDVREGFKSGWFLTDARRDKSVSWRYAKHLFAADCAKRLLSENAFAAYNPAGQVVLSDDWQFNRWQNVIPNSMADAILETLCQ